MDRAMLRLLWISFLLAVTLLGCNLVLTIRYRTPFEDLLDGVILSQIAFTSYCLVAPRTGRWKAIGVSILAIIAWVVAAASLIAKNQNVLYSQLLPVYAAGMAIYVFLYVAATIVMFSFAKTNRRRLTLRTMLALTAASGVVLAFAIDQVDADALPTGVVFYIMPMILLYLLACWAVQASNISIWKLPATTAIAVAYGLAMKVFGRGSPGWHLPVAYTLALQASLLALRMADFYARAPGADASGSKVDSTATAE